MALTQEDLEALAGFIEGKVKDVAGELISQAKADVEAAAEGNAVQNRVSVVGKPDVDPEAGPQYYVHLANGKVIESYDSASTHMSDPDSGDQVAVIGRYQIGASE
jgi:hypothetical protein